MFCKKGTLKNFAKFTGKRLCQNLFFKKETLEQMFSYEFCEISKKTFFIEYLWWLFLLMKKLSRGAQRHSCFANFEKICRKKPLMVTDYQDYRSVFSWNFSEMLFSRIILSDYCCDLKWCIAKQLLNMERISKKWGI